MVNKFTIFREMLDYMAHIGKVTDADLNSCVDRLRIVGETADEEIVFCVLINKKKEEEKDA